MYFIIEIVESSFLKTFLKENWYSLGTSCKGIQLISKSSFREPCGCQISFHPSENLLCESTATMPAIQQVDFWDTWIAESVKQVEF